MNSILTNGVPRHSRATSPTVVKLMSKMSPSVATSKSASSHTFASFSSIVFVPETTSLTSVPVPILVLKRLVKLMVSLAMTMARSALLECFILSAKSLTIDFCLALVFPEMATI